MQQLWGLSSQARTVAMIFACRLLHDGRTVADGAEIEASKNVDDDYQRGRRRVGNGPILHEIETLQYYSIG